MMTAEKGNQAAGLSDPRGAEHITLKVDGMSCAHCVAAVDRALRAVPGVKDVNVDLEAGRATVRGQADTAALTAAIAAEGYTAAPQG